MNTKFIGVKDFRQNISDYAKRAQKGDARYIVMNRNKPLFEIKAFADDEYLDSFVADILKAEADMARGNVHTQGEVMKELGIT
jgi:antitoxin (DNA-binding transcriptional repressor) of toxin-antitoxin stability system